MSAPHWQTENVQAPEPDALFDAVADLIDMEAQAFEPAAFRAAVSRVLATAQAQHLNAIAAQVAANAMEKLLTVTQRFNGSPELIADTIRVALRGHKAAGFKQSQLARSHGITRQSFHERVIRVAKHLGITYRREKPHRAGRKFLSYGEHATHGRAA